MIIALVLKSNAFLKSSLTHLHLPAIESIPTSIERKDLRWLQTEGELSVCLCSRLRWLWLYRQYLRVYIEESIQCSVSHSE